MTYRIGTGAGFSTDRLDPALHLLEHGALDCIVFECVGERTLAFGRRGHVTSLVRTGCAFIARDLVSPLFEPIEVRP